YPRFAQIHRRRSVSPHEMRWYAAVLLGLGAAIAACRYPSSPEPPATPGDEPDGPPWFEDVTDKLGLDFTHDPGPDGTYFMPQCMGSGCALCDLDGDGRPDIVLLQNAGAQSKSTNKLFRQKPDGTFEDVSAGSGLDFAGYNLGVAIGDVNNDGRPDVLI